MASAISLPFLPSRRSSREASVCPPAAPCAPSWRSLRSAYRRLDPDLLLRDSVLPVLVSRCRFVRAAYPVLRLRRCRAVTPPSAVTRSRRDRARARRATNLGWCTCGALVRVDGFRCRGAYDEYHRSGLCQDCQDRVFLSRDASAGVSYALRRGLVVGAQRSAQAVAAIPFVFTCVGRPIAWEARDCVLVGPEGAPCDPWGDLDPLCDLLADHQIRVHEAETGTDLHIAECIGAPALVLGPDRDVLDACDGAFALSGDVRRVALGDTFAWTERFGFPLTPLHRFALRAGFTSWRESDAGALRRCAWLAASLAFSLPESTSGGTVLDAVLSAFTRPHTEVLS